jgi:hypothetical protein
VGLDRLELRRGPAKQSIGRLSSVGDGHESFRRARAVRRRPGPGVADAQGTYLVGVGARGGVAKTEDSQDRRGSESVGGADGANLPEPVLRRMVILRVGLDVVAGQAGRTPTTGRGGAPQFFWNQPDEE